MIYRASRFAVVQGEGTCWHCKATTPVAALLVGSHESRWDEEDDWEIAEGPVLLTRLVQVNTEALKAYLKQAPWVRRMDSKTAQETYWGNTCTTCQSLQGDWYLTEPGAPFFPETTAEEQRLTLTWHQVPIEAEAGGSGSSWMDRLVERSQP